MTTPRFAPGDRVRVVALHAPGHIRTPFYVRGKAGVIERVLDAFPNPEERAFGRSGLPPRRLYRVRFPLRELWWDYAGPETDTVDIEIYEHWLEPLEAP